MRVTRGLAALVPLSVIVAQACSSTYGEIQPTIDAGQADAGQADAGQGETADAESEASTCTIACGGPGGRCGSVDACGLTIACGECAPPYECVNGSCQCAAATCTSLRASCGELVDGCGGLVSCGTCDGGTCQTTDGGDLACGAGPCVPQDKTVTCADRCQTVPNNCAENVDCGGCSTGLCGAGGSATTCGCPSRPKTIGKYLLGGYHCYATNANGCPNRTYQGELATLYTVAYEGLVPLYRCKVNLGGTDLYLLSTKASCTANNTVGWVNEGPIGYCATSEVCGARPLKRFQHPTTADIVHTLGNAPAGYSISLGEPCFVWPP